MVMNSLDVNSINDIVTKFQRAIYVAKYNREFSIKDRMHNFPGGCCDDACDLLAFYLYNKFQICTEQKNGVYRDKNPYNTTNHAWLLINRDIVIDITCIQFECCAGIKEEVYVGKETDFYKRMENIRIYNNYDITKDERLWNDYKVIMKYMENAML